MDSADQRRTRDITVLALERRVMLSSATFATPTPYGNISSLGVTVADVNGDGLPDIIAPESGAGGSSVDVYLNQGNGTFGTAHNYNAASATLGAGQPYGLAVADVNGDGHPDIVTANFGGTMSVLLNNGNGVFASSTVYAAGSEPDGVAVGDLNGDGLPDIAVANRGSDSVSVYVNAGNGAFESAVNFSVGSSPDSIGMADLNHDGRLDIYTADLGGFVSILFNDNGGNFSSALNLTVPGIPADAVAGDFTGDGNIDIATANGDGTVSILPGDGQGNFGSPINTTVFSTGISAQFLTTADFNGDGKADLAVVAFNANDVGVLIGNGDGTFQAPIAIAPGLLGGSITAADINGDGQPDLVIGSYDPSGASAEFTTILNTTSAVAAPVVKTIGGVDPSFGSQGLASHDVGFTSINGKAQDGVQSIIIGTIGSAPSESFGITRYNADGSVDTTFGTNGVVTSSFSGTDDVPAAVDVLSSGQILVAGTATTYVSGAATGSEFLVARYNANGSLDTSFAQGVGAAFVSFSPTANALTTDVLKAMTISPTGVIYLGGESNASGTTGQDFAVTALNSDGSVDTGFNKTGKELEDFAGGNDVTNSLALQTNGDLVAAGSASAGGIPEIALARFLPTGVLDKHFGTDGLLVTNVGGVDDSASSVLIQPKGQIIIGGLSASGSGATLSTDFVVARYTSSGKIDKTFGNGPVVTSFGQPSAITQIVLSASGEIIASGKTTASLTDVSNPQLAVARYTTRGVLDTSFNGTGKTIINPGIATVTSGLKAVPLAVIAIEPLDDSSLGADFEAFTNSEQGVVSITPGGEILVAGNSGTSTVEAELIAAGVDLVTSLLTTIPTAVVGGAKGAASVSIVEDGTDQAAGVITIDLEVSADAQGGDATSFKAFPEKINLRQKQIHSYRVSFNYPSSVATGNYYLVAVVDNGTSAALQDLNTANNLAASSTAVNIAPPFISLSGSGLSTPSTFVAGKSAQIIFTLLNNGNVIARGNSTVEIILSTDQTAADGSTIDTAKLPINLAINKPHVTRVSFKLPTTLTPGTYYLIAVIDPLDSLGSTDQTSSTIVDPTQVIIV